MKFLPVIKANTNIFLSFMNGWFKILFMYLNHSYPGSDVDLPAILTHVVDIQTYMSYKYIFVKPAVIMY
jgi:hypothetical protein